METIQMNKLITSSTDEKTDEIDEILQDAENIILASNGDTKKHIRNKGLIIFAIVIAILVLAFSTVFALININSNKIMNGVFIQGIDVSGLTTDEAKEKVSNIVNKHLAYKLWLSVTILKACYARATWCNFRRRFSHKSILYCWS